MSQASHEKQSSPDKYTAWAVLEKGGKFEKFQYKPEALGPDDIEIRVTHCGFCYSDVAMLRDERKCTTFPFIGGHEAIGVITKMGSVESAESKQNEKSKKSQSSNHVLKIADCVGFGWQRDSCFECNYCLAGKENVCRYGKVATIIGNHGGFSDYVRFNKKFVFKIPDSLDSMYAAPLLCAGFNWYTKINCW